MLGQNPLKIISPKGKTIKFLRRKVYFKDFFFTLKAENFIMFYEMVFKFLFTLAIKHELQRFIE